MEYYHNFLFFTFPGYLPPPFLQFWGENMKNIVLGENDFISYIFRHELFTSEWMD